MSTWLKEVGFIPLLHEEILKIRQALYDKAMLQLEGRNTSNNSYYQLFEKLRNMHGSDYKIVMPTEDDRDKF